MPDEDEIRELKASVESLSARVARLENERAVEQQIVAPAKPDSVLGVTAINRIGAITVAIGIIFFFKYAVDENLIGAAAGVVLGVLFGLALIGAGEWLFRHSQTVFAQGIAGCGLATLYISFYASFAFYKLIAEPVGFFALFVVSAIGVALSIRFRSPAIAVLGTIGALLTPMLLHNPHSQLWLEFAYLVLISCTAVAISTKERWPVLVGITGPLSLVTAWVLFEPKHATGFCSFCLASALVNFASALRSKGSVRSVMYLVGHVGVLMAAVRIVSLAFTDHSVISEAESILLLLYGIAALAYGIVRNSDPDRFLGLSLVGIVIAKLYVLDVWQLSRIYRITAFLALGGLLFVASWVYSRRPSSQR